MVSVSDYSAYTEPRGGGGAGGPRTPFGQLNSQRAGGLSTLNWVNRILTESVGLVTGLGEPLALGVSQGIFAATVRLPRPGSDAIHPCETTRIRFGGLWAA